MIKTLVKMHTLVCTFAVLTSQDQIFFQKETQILASKIYVNMLHLAHTCFTVYSLVTIVTGTQITSVM